MTAIKFALIFILISGSFFTHSKESIKDLTTKNGDNKSSSSEIKISPTSSSVQASDSSGSNSEINLHSVGLGLGQTTLMGKFRDQGDSDITVDMFYNYVASHAFDLNVNFHYSKQPFKDQYVNLQGLAIGTKGKVVQFDAFSPFIIGGLGFYQPVVKRDIGDGVIKKSERKTVLGYHLGAGIDLRLNRHLVSGLLFHIHNPFDVKQEIGPEVTGAYVKLMLTLMYVF